MHTWSLAVEAQYYLGYPFLLMLLKQFSLRHNLFILLILTVLSCAMSEYGVRHHPSATFYLLPTRAWELLLGGLTCFVPAVKLTNVRYQWERESLTSTKQLANNEKEASKRRLARRHARRLLSLGLKGRQLRTAWRLFRESGLTLRELASGLSRYR